MNTLFLNVKTAIVTVVILIILGLAGTTVMYKKSYESKVAELASLQEKYASLDDHLKACGDAAQKTADEAKKRVEEAQKAIDAATLNAKKNESYAQSLLARQASGDECRAAEELYEEYITKVQSK